MAGFEAQMDAIQRAAAEVAGKISTTETELVTLKQALVDADAAVKADPHSEEAKATRNFLRGQVAALEQGKAALVQEKAALEQKAAALAQEKAALEQKAAALAQEKAELEKQKTLLLEREGAAAAAAARLTPIPSPVEGASWPLVASLPGAGSIMSIPSCKDIDPDDSNDKKPSVMYVRRQVRHLWDKLNSTEMREIACIGPPGTGKTLAFWAYLLHRVSVGEGVVGVFIRCDGGHARCVTVRKVVQELKFSVYPSKIGIGQLGAMEGYVPFVERMFSADVVGSKCVAVLDGLTEKNNNLLLTVITHFGNLAEKKGNMFARVSSLGFKLDTRHRPHELWHFFTGWDFEEYFDACRQAPALMDWMEKLEDSAPEAPPSSPPCKRAKQDDKDICDVCLQKFFYAGRSARWFFTLSRAEVIERVNFFLNALAPGSDPEKVATLHIVFVEGDVLEEANRERHVVSAYALRKIRDTVHAAGLFNELVAAVSAIAGSGNALVAPLRGWMFELAIHQALRRSSSISIFRKSGGSLCLPAAGVPVVKFTEINQIAITTPPHSDGKADPTWDVWLSPTQYSQGGFDFAYVSISKQVMHVTFLQTTVAKEHSVKWRFMLQLLAYLCGFPTNTARREFLAATGDPGNSHGGGSDDRELPAVMEAVSLNDQTVAQTLAIKSEVPPTIFGQTVTHVKVTLILLTHSPGDAEYFVTGPQDVVHRDFEVVVGSVRGIE